MKKIVRYLFLALLLLTAGGIPLTAEETLPPKLQTLADEAYHSYSARETENFFEAIQNVKEATEFSQYQETYYRACSYEAIHKAVEEFVGGAEPSDDLTKMCIKMNGYEFLEEKG